LQTVAHPFTVTNSLAQDVYQLNGFLDRAEYIDSLREEYGAELVDCLTSVLPPSEDFDGLISELEDNAYYFD
jgi:hypothetical protein